MAADEVMTYTPTQAEILEELTRIAEANRGVLLTQAVVEAARPQDSILHDQFTWNDGEAAEKYRLWEARHLISVVVNDYSDGKETLESRVFVSLTPDRSNGGGYRLMTKVLSDEEQRQQLMSDALHELEIFRSKYARLKQLSSVLKPIGKLLGKQKTA